MNKFSNRYLNHLKLRIRHYFDLLLDKEHAKIQFKKNLKRVEGFSGFLYEFSLGFILKIFLFFFLVGGYKSGIDFGNFIHNFFSNNCCLYKQNNLLLNKLF